MPSKQKFPLDRRMWTEVDKKGRPFMDDGLLILHTSKKSAEGELSLSERDEEFGHEIVRVKAQVDTK